MKHLRLTGTIQILSGCPAIIVHEEDFLCERMHLPSLLPRLSLPFPFRRFHRALSLDREASEYIPTHITMAGLSGEAAVTNCAERASIKKS